MTIDANFPVSGGSNDLLKLQEYINEGLSIPQIRNTPSFIEADIDFRGTVTERDSLPLIPVASQGLVYNSADYSISIPPEYSGIYLIQVPLIQIPYAAASSTTYAKAPAAIKIFTNDQVYYLANASSYLYVIRVRPDQTTRIAACLGYAFYSVAASGWMFYNNTSTVAIPYTSNSPLFIVKL